jgi:tripartite-type tricarboxylate transporter receptor subunit TctC
MKTALALLASLFVVFQAQAQAWPDRPLRLLVGFPPGGLIDQFARTIQPGLAAGLGQPVIVENRGGAAGTLAEAVVAKSPPDGYSLLITPDSPPANPYLYKNLGYDLFKDLAPVTMLLRVPLVLAVHPTVAANNLADLIALARSRPGQIAYATTGAGTSNHLAMEYLNKAAGISTIHVPYKGGAQVMTDLVGGQVPSTLISITLAAPQVRAGRIRAVAVTGDKRAPLLPEVQTFVEGGFADFPQGQWSALFVPAGTPAAIIHRLHAELDKTVRTPEVQKRFADLGAETVMSSPAELAAFLKKEHQRIGEQVRESNITAN